MAYEWSESMLFSLIDTLWCVNNTQNCVKDQKKLKPKFSTRFLTKFFLPEIEFLLKNVPHRSDKRLGTTNSKLYLFMLQV